jgi:hypothetical protein
MGCIIGGIKVEMWGRRRMKLIGKIGMKIGWILIELEKNKEMIIYGRIKEGL